MIKIKFVDGVEMELLTKSWKKIIIIFAYIIVGLLLIILARKINKPFIEEFHKHFYQEQELIDYNSKELTIW